MDVRETAGFHAVLQASCKVAGKAEAPEGRGVSAGSVQVFVNHEIHLRGVASCPDPGGGDDTIEVRIAGATAQVTIEDAKGYRSFMLKAPLALSGRCQEMGIFRGTPDDPAWKEVTKKRPISPVVHSAKRIL